jgi:death-on-curing family protein
MDKQLKYPAIEEIVEINRRLGEGGVLINKGNLEFILRKVELEKSLIKKASILLRDIIRLHPFVDGNKRTAFHAMLYFLELNDKRFKYGHEDESKIEKMLNRIARKRETEEEVEKWIERGLL